MAGIITNVGEDIKSLRQLRQEIENVKKALGSIDINVKIDIRKELEAKLQSLTKQYDTLVAKAAEADAKLMESAARIDKAVNTITEAQDKAAKASSQQSTVTADKAQVAAVEGQAKAYSDLKNEIDIILGTREHNIAKMLEEQNAIRLINAEIAQINKSRQTSGNLTHTEASRLRQLNNDLMLHKQALSEIRGELSNNVKLDIAATGSMNELSQSLSRMRVAYRALNEEERNSKFGQNLLKSIQEADAKIKELDAAIGNHQRNVGNYQGFNGLSMSVQQIVRELPSATMGVNMFFLAISNNLPILADQIKYAKEANKAMKAAGQEPVPVWKQLASSLFSWQSAMMVGISLLTVYGKDIVKWIGNLLKANDAQEQARKEAEAFAETIKKSNEEWRNSVAQTAAQQITSYREMQREWNALGNNLNEKKKYVEANKTAFNQLGFAVNGVSDAERIMVGNTDAVVASIMARAKASAYRAEIEKAYAENIRQTEQNKKTVKGGGYYEKAKVGDQVQSIKGLSKNDYKIDYNKWTDIEGNVTYEKIYKLTASGVRKENQRRNAVALYKLEENNRKANDQLKKRLNFLQDGLNTATKENQDLLKKIGVSEYKGYENTNSNKNTPIKQIDYAKMAHERSDAERELADKASQAYIDALQEGYEKEKAQRELNHKKELDELDKYRRDFLQRKIEEAKAKFEADPKNKGKVFKSSSVKLSQDENDKFDAMRSNIRQKHLNEEKQMHDAELEAMNDFLQKYGTLQQQRVALEASYNKQIEDANKAHETWRAASLQAELEDKLRELDLNKFKDAIDWDSVFNDLDSLSTSYLNELREKLRGLLSNGNLDIDDMEVVSGKIRDIDAAIDKESSRWGIANEALSRHKRLIQEAVDAMEQLQKAREKSAGANLDVYSSQDKIRQALGEKGAGMQLKDITSANKESILSGLNLSGDEAERLNKLFGELAKSEVKAAKATESLAKASEKNAKAQDKAKLSLHERADILAKGMQGMLDKVSDLPELMQTLGLGDSGIGKAVSNGVDALNSGANAAKDFASDNYIGAALNGIKAIGSVGKMFGIGGGNADKVTKSIDRLTERNKLLEQAIDDLADEMKNARGAKAIDVSTRAEKLQRETNENYKKIAQEQASYHNSHKSFNKYWSGYNSEQINRLSQQIGRKWNGDIWDLTPEEMKQLRSNVDMWEKIQKTGKGGYGNRVADKLNDYINQAGKLEEITKQLNESLTGTTEDNVFSDFMNSLNDLANGSEDVFDNIADNWQKMVNKMVLNNIVGSKYQEQLKKWYTDFSNVYKDEKIDKGELSKLKSAYDDIVRSGKDDIEGLIKTGLIVPEDSQSQKATINESRSLSEETGSQIVGRLTAVQIANEQRNAKLDATNGHLSLMNTTIADIRAMMASYSSSAPRYGDEASRIMSNAHSPAVVVNFPEDKFNELRNEVKALGGMVSSIMDSRMESLMEQREISQNTRSIIKPIQEMERNISDVRRNTERL